MEYRLPVCGEEVERGCPPEVGIERHTEQHGEVAVSPQTGWERSLGIGDESFISEEDTGQHDGDDERSDDTCGAPSVVSSGGDSENEKDKGNGENGDADDVQSSGLLGD